MEEKFITKEDIRNNIPDFKGIFGGMLASMAMILFSFRKINRIYSKSDRSNAVDFSRTILESTGIKLEVENVEVLDRFKGKPFITVSNHPYGHLDGLALISVIGSRRKDYMMIVNFIISMVKPLKERFIVINPYRETGKVDMTAIESIRRCLKHLEDGKSLGLFPAAAVSMPHPKGLGFTVKDRPWKISTVKLVIKAGVPVIPVYFSGQNSWFFNLLGSISWKLRSLRLPRELCNKKGHVVRMVFGEPITPEELRKQDSVRSAAAFLRAKTYELAKEPAEISTISVPR